jgi:hypothetical protein
MNSAKALLSFPKGWLILFNYFLITALMFLSLSFTSLSGTLCLGVLEVEPVVECLRRLGETSSEEVYSLRSPYVKFTLMCKLRRIFFKKFSPKTTFTFFDSGFSRNSAGSGW